MATAMFTDTVCLLMDFATTFFLLWHVDQRRILSRGLRRSSCDDAFKQTLFKWRQRCILGFLLVAPVQLPRGFLLLFWPNPLVMDLMSVLSGPIHYLSFLLLVLRNTSRGSPDEDIALGPILPQSGNVDAPVQDSPDVVNPDGSNVCFYLIATGGPTTDSDIQNEENLVIGSQAPENRFGKPSVTKPRTHGLIIHSSHCQTSEPPSNSSEAGKNPAHVQPVMARTSSSSPNRHGAGQWTNAAQFQVRQGGIARCTLPAYLYRGRGIIHQICP
ncbi:uncharacterized protein EI90DRAFT_58871 [Cantharellus anzutake]|uniref:uncharacterized protein n=1 Tax=Cantharellus anzutake TaxID=1750568 RepID=UPI0019054500|nr:uncharacterized protein EI90DRAFT_58871 [Cantharellus anzutake]KAF8344230.1 hypothetical protein EI90DRAFT_58871 [Cantharellus anzutake]